MAIKRGSRPEWLNELARAIGVPIDTLLDYAPDDPGAFRNEPTIHHADARLTAALKYAAEQRLREYRKQTRQQRRKRAPVAR